MLKIPRRTLDRSFYERHPAEVARGLLGQAIISELGDEVVGGLIIETEAYLADQDPASHSFRGMTNRNRTMFGPPGGLYVYSIHAKYCLNAVTEAAGRGSAVLIRALEPLWGGEVMLARRGNVAIDELCRGPAKLCQALAVTRLADGEDLCRAEGVWISGGVNVPDELVVASPRIGISQAQDQLLRFFIDRHPLVSGPRRFHAGKVSSAMRLVSILPSLDQ